MYSPDIVYIASGTARRHLGNSTINLNNARTIQTNYPPVWKRQKCKEKGSDDECRHGHRDYRRGTEIWPNLTSQCKKPTSRSHAIFGNQLTSVRPIYSGTTIFGIASYLEERGRCVRISVRYRTESTAHRPPSCGRYYGLRDRPRRAAVRSKLCTVLKVCLVCTRPQRCWLHLIRSTNTQARHVGECSKVPLT